MFWSRYPYTDAHELNLDWILHLIWEMDKSLSEFEALNKITFSGEWDITKQYPAWCIVNWNNGQEGYISIKPVPAGVTIDNTDYWVSIVNYTAVIADLQNRVIALENDMATAQSDITTAQSDISRLYDVVYIASEYGVSPDNADNTQALQDLIDLAATTDGEIVFKRGIYKFSGTLTIYRNVCLRGLGTVIFDYTDGTDSTTFITITNLPGTNPDISDYDRFGSIPCIMDSIILMGEAMTSYPYIPTAWKNATALSIACNEITFRNCMVKSFDKAVEYGNNSYLVTFESCRFSHNNHAIHYDASGLTNSGEALKFIDCVFGNNVLAIYNDRGMMEFIGCSLDYNKQIAISCHATSSQNNAFEKFTNCHLEDNDGMGDYNYVRFDNIYSSYNQYTCRTFVNCVFHSFKNAVYNFKTTVDEVMMTNCSFFFVRSVTSPFFSGVKAKIRLLNNTFSDRSVSQFVMLGNTGTLTDSTFKSFETNVVDGTASVADDEITLTNNLYTTAIASSGKITVPKGYNTIVLGVHFKSCNYNPDRTGSLGGVRMYDNEGNLIASYNLGNNTVGDATDPFYRSGAFPLTEQVASFDVIIRGVGTGNTSSIVFDEVNAHLA